MTVATVSSLRAAPALPPKVLLYRGSLDASVSKVDLAAGKISGVSLMTADLQPRGYQMFVDGQTLTTFSAALGDKLKAYLKHSWGDRTGEEAGYWQSFRVSGSQLLADFTALKAWRTHSAAAFDTLFELAAEMPDEFGASAVFSYTLAWVRANGEEIPTQATAWRWNEEAGDYELQFTPSAPADALRALPSVRVTEAFSTDFVDVPAANRGLFSAADLLREKSALGDQSPAQPLDAARDSISPGSPATNSTSFAMIKELYAKFSGNHAQLSRAIALHTENDKLSFSDIVGKIERESLDTELAQLRTGATQLTAFNAALEKAGFKAAGDKTALDALLAEHAQFKADAAAHTASIAALKAAGFEAKDGKTATDLALAALKKSTGDIATLRAGGSVAINTEAPVGGAAPVKLSGLARREAALKAQLAAQQPKSN